MNRRAETEASIAEARASLELRQAEADRDLAYCRCVVPVRCRSYLSNWWCAACQRLLDGAR